MGFLAKVRAALQDSMGVEVDVEEAPKREPEVCPNGCRVPQIDVSTMDEPWVPKRLCPKCGLNYTANG